MEDVENVKMHLRDHQTYPATKEELVAECNKLSDFSEKDKREFEDMLPNGVYNSAAEVMAAVGI